MAKLIMVILVLAGTPLVLAVGAFMHNRLPWTDPPGFSKRLQIYLTTNQAQTSPNPEFPELEVRVYPLAKDMLISVLEQAISSLDWDILMIDRDQYQVHAVVTSTLLRFRDDVSVTLRSVEEGNRTWVYVHAGARTGKGDFGTNARHILDLYSAVERTIREHEKAENK